MAVGCLHLKSVMLHVLKVKPTMNMITLLVLKNVHGPSLIYRTSAFLCVLFSIFCHSPIRFSFSAQLCRIISLIYAYYLGMKG